MYKFTALFALLFVSTSLFAQLSATVSTVNGMVEGAVSSNAAVMVYKGLPYAAPPVGENRWRAPQPAAAWSGVRDATSDAARCLDAGILAGAGEPAGSEDCLYLNVWAPAQVPPAGVPVIVWIHGSPIDSGLPAADGANLASKGAVVVSFNYRLASFGFMAHPELTAEAPNNSSGNYAMLDMIKVLEWVYDNIAAFGGDPVNITLMGEASGATAVAALMASPLSAGLFHHAILQGGGWMGPAIGKQPTLAEREALGAENAARFGASSIADLRNASAQQVLENFPTSDEFNVDGYFLAKDTSLTFEAGENLPVDVLAGSSMDAALLFGAVPQDADAFRQYSREKYGDLSERFLALYPAGSDQQASASYLKSFSDELAWQMRKLGSYQSQRGLGAFVYYFNRVPPVRAMRGATHLAERAYVLNQHEAMPDWTEADRKLADTMASYWVTFATRTNPNREGLPQWPRYLNNEVGNVQILGDEVTTETSLVPSAEALEFFEAVYRQHLQSL